jgi:phage recombination protein Bet
MATTNSSNAMSLMAQLSAKLGVDATKLYKAFATVCFSQGGKEPSNEEMMALLIVANAYDLNPFLREIFAFRGKGGNVQPVISIDGWLTILNRQKDYDGSEVVFSDKIINIGSTAIPEWCEVRIYRKSLSHPVVIREYAEEVYIANGVWSKYPKRMLRHKATIQAIRFAFGISGALDEDAVREADKLSDVPAVTQRAALRSSAPQVKAIEAAMPLSAPQQAQVERLIAKVVKEPAFEKNAMAWIEQKVDPQFQAAYRKALSQGLAQAASAADAVEAEIAETVEAVETATEVSEPAVSEPEAQTTPIPVKEEAAFELESEEVQP